MMDISKDINEKIEKKLKNKCILSMKLRKLFKPEDSKNVEQAIINAFKKIDDITKEEIYHYVNLNDIYNGDALDVLRRFNDECIDLIITSPPYDDLRDYKGYSFDFEGIALEMTRVLREGGVIVWVVADKIKNNSMSLTSHRQALVFKYVCKLNVHDIMIYEKNSSPFPPRPDGIRYTKIFEFMYIFSKGKPKTHNLICDKKNKTAGQTNFGNPTNRQKDGSLKRQGSKRITPEYSPRNNIWRYYTGKKFTSRDGNVHKHPAPFPDLLALDHIRTWSNPEDIVLDVFAGSGTTCVMSKVLDRHYIGIEIANEYCELIEV